MNINLHVERLVLDGLPVTRSQGPLLQAAVEAELASLLAKDGLPPYLAVGGALPPCKGEQYPTGKQQHPKSTRPADCPRSAWEYQSMNGETRESECINN